MSLIPFLYDVDPWEMRRSRRNDWDLFGLGVTPRDIQNYVNFPRAGSQLLANRVVQDVVPATVGKDGFQVSVDVQQFRPNEITVKTVDNMVVVEGKHEERPDEHGHISRHFVRKYTLPKEYNLHEVVSTLSSDGVLTLMAPKPSNEKGSNERVVHILHTGPAHLHVKDHNGGAEQEKKVKAK